MLALCQQQPPQRQNAQHRHTDRPIIISSNEITWCDERISSCSQVEVENFRMKVSASRKNCAVNAYKFICGWWNGIEMNISALYCCI